MCPRGDSFIVGASVRDEGILRALGLDSGSVKRNGTMSIRRAAVVLALSCILTAAGCPTTDRTETGNADIKLRVEIQDDDVTVVRE